LDALDITLPNISVDEDDHKQSFTNNFIIDIPMANPVNGLAIRAGRLGVGADKEYYLFLRRKTDGEELLWCSTGWGAYNTDPDNDLTDSPAAAICKTISNGNKKGVIYRQFSN